MDIEYHTSVKQELCMYVCVCVCNRRKKRELFFIFLRILRNKERSDRFFAKLTFITAWQTNWYAINAGFAPKNNVVPRQVPPSIEFICG